MKQIITVFAILISGIASAQLFEVSVCDGEIVEDGNRYMILPELQQQIVDRHTNRNHGISFVCVDNVRVSDGIPYISRYFRRYHGAGSPDFRGNQYTGTEETIVHYTFPNTAIIRVYPANYANGDRFTLNLISEVRLGYAPERAKHSKFEVRRTANGSSIFTLHDTAKASWDHARTH